MKKLFTVTIGVLLVLLTTSAQRLPALYAGPNQTIVPWEVAHLRGKSSGVPHVWKTSGTGRFKDPYALITGYIPSKADILKGRVRLTLYNPQDPSISSYMALKIRSCNEVNVIPQADTICGFDSGTTYDIQAEVKGTGYYMQWTTSGSGFFHDEISANTTYEPSRSDLGSGSVWLKLTVYDKYEKCPTVADSVFLKFNDPARINLPDETISNCGDAPIYIDGNLSGTANTIYWTTNGLGTFSENHSRETYYISSFQDRVQEYITITGITNDPSGPCPAATDVMTIQLNGPWINAGTDLIRCGSSYGGEVSLEATLNSHVSNLTWSSNGYGDFDDPYAYNATYFYSDMDVNQAFVELYVTAEGGGCDPVTDTVLLHLQAEPKLEFPEPSVYQCATDPVFAQVYLYGYASSGTWTTTGTGTFTNPNTTYTDYYPGAEDLAMGCVDLIFTSNDPAGPCVPVSGAMSACFYDCSEVFRTGGETSQTLQVHLQPNPAKDVLDVSMSEDVKEYDLYVTNITGSRENLVWQDNGRLDISSLKPGLYFLHVTKVGTYHVSRFVKSN